MATCLPAVVPGAGFDEDVGAVDGCGGGDEVGCWGEEFVGCVDDPGAQGACEEVFCCVRVGGCAECWGT